METVMPAIASAASGRMTRRRVLGAYLQEARSECLRYLRAPGFILPMTLFSTVFYLMFGVLINHGNAEAARYLLASYSAFGIIGPGLFGFGASLAIERDGGLLTLKRALPMPPGAYLLGKMVVSENYPQLKADGLFQNLQAQLEGTENRVTVARNRYVQAVQEYNTLIRTFPTNLTAKMFGYKIKPNFSVDNEKSISTAPKVDFGTAAAPASAASTH